MKKSANYTTSSGDQFFFDSSVDSISLFIDEGNGNCLSLNLKKDEVDAFIQAIKDEAEKSFV